MVHSNLRRRMTALVFVAALMVAGARPAAAEGFGWREALDWLSRVWGGITLQADGAGLKHQSSADTVDAGLEIDPNGGPTTDDDCGLEIDPSGKPICKPTGAASGG